MIRTLLIIVLIILIHRRPSGLAL